MKNKGTNNRGEKTFAISCIIFIIRQGGYRVPPRTTFFHRASKRNLQHKSRSLRAASFIDRGVLISTNAIDKFHISTLRLAPRNHGISNEAIKHNNPSRVALDRKSRNHCKTCFHVSPFLLFFSFLFVLSSSTAKQATNFVCTHDSEICCVPRVTCEIVRELVTPSTGN